MAFLAGVLEPDMLADLELRGEVIELFSDGFAEGLLKPATAGADPLFFGKCVFDAYAGQMLGERFTTVTVGPFLFLRTRGLGDGSFSGSLSGRIFHVLAQELEEILQPGFGEPFGLGTEMGTQELLEPVLQRLVLGGELQDHLVQQFDVCWERGGGEWCHAENNDSSFPG